MAKYDVEYACGHTAEVALFGSYRDREARLKQMAEQVCPACRKAEFQQRGAEAHSKQIANGLPALVGSEKQIAWAAQIRESALPHLQQIREQIAGNSSSPADLREKALSIIDGAIQQTEAHWWIEHRMDVAGVGEILNWLRRQLK